MQYVKEAFGFVILALPVFLLERVIGDLWGLRLWSLLGLAFFGWAFALSLRSTRGWARALQLLLLAAAVIAARPLQDWKLSVLTRRSRRLNRIWPLPASTTSNSSISRCNRRGANR